MVMKDDWFDGRFAMVTGAGSGIGRAVALKLGMQRCMVGVHYCRNRDGASALCGEIEQAGGRAVPMQADLSDTKQIDSMFAAFDEVSGGRLDMLVNNAGEWMDKCVIADCSETQWDRMFDINARSVFACCQRGVRRMSGTGGAIVNIGSVAAHTGGGGGTVPYAAAKAAVHTFTRGLAKEVARDNIRVNAVAPGMVDTAMLEGRVTTELRAQLEQMTPIGRFADPGEVADVVLMLLSPAGEYMIGQVVDVNGGLLMR